jgi:HTH-type transcriptional regulator/antitoxin HigA
MIDSHEGDEAELLSILIEKFEDDFYPIESPDPIEAIT